MIWFCALAAASSGGMFGFLCGRSMVSHYTHLRAMKRMYGEQYRIRRQMEEIYLARIEHEKLLLLYRCEKLRSQGLLATVRKQRRELRAIQRKMGKAA